jgi:tetratricopeptide (TPR) repeat protein
MQQLFDTFGKFGPVFKAYPRWLQFFFFAVVLQVFLLTFIILFQHLLGNKGSGTAKVRGQNVVETTDSEKIFHTDLNGSAESSEIGDLRGTERSSNPALALSLSNLATLYRAQGKYKQAEKVWHRVLEIQERAYGRDHPAYANSLQNLSVVLTETGRNSEALEYQTAAVDIFRRVYGDVHPDTATALNHLAAIYLKLARYGDAAPLVEEALSIRRRSLGPAHPDEIPILENLLVLYQKSGNKDKVQVVTHELKELKSKFGTQSTDKQKVE